MEVDAVETDQKRPSTAGAAGQPNIGDEQGKTFTNDTSLEVGH